MNHATSHDDSASNGILQSGIWADAPNILPSVQQKAPPMVPPRRVWGLNLALIDDRLLIREGFARSLEAAHEGLSTVCFSSSAEWQAASDRHSEISLVVLCCSGRKFAASHDEIRDLSTGGIPVIVVSAEGSADEIRETLALGARGFIPECVEVRLAVAAMYLVRAGGVYLPETVLHASPSSAEDQIGAANSPLHGIFTERQTAVVEALCQGKPNKIIAYELNMRESTVKVHIRNVMIKLKAKNRTEVVYITNTLRQNGKLD